MMRLIGLLFLILLLFSCKESRKDRIVSWVNEWSGKTIVFPDSMCLTSYKDDTVIVKYTRDKTPYTILNYVDTIGCMSCKLQLPSWKQMIEDIDSIYPNKVSLLMVFNPKGKKKFVKHLRNSHFDSFVYMDEKDTLNHINHFLHEDHFCTFLLDKDDKVVVVGNPILKYNVKKMYLDIISGESLSSVVGQSLSTVSISKHKVDLGSFMWSEVQETEITISNTGKVPLVINDIITSCGCISVEYSKKPFQPNKTLSLKIRYKADHPEYFDKTITIYCNAENSPLRLRITGNAK